MIKNLVIKVADNVYLTQPEDIYIEGGMIFLRKRDKLGDQYDSMCLYNSNHRDNRCSLTLEEFYEEIISRLNEDLNTNQKTSFIDIDEIFKNNLSDSKTGIIYSYSNDCYVKGSEYDSE